MIEVLQAFEDGKEIEYRSRIVDENFTSATTPIWNFSHYDYRIKPQPTREEITAQWVKDNNIVVGSKVRVVGLSIYGTDSRGEILTVFNIEYPSQLGKCISLGNDTEDKLHFSESLEPYKEQYQPFTYEDYMAFMDSKVKIDDCIGQVTMCNSYGVMVGGRMFSYKSAFNNITFIGGSKFGKEI